MSLEPIDHVLTYKTEKEHNLTFPKVAASGASLVRSDSELIVCHLRILRLFIELLQYTTLSHLPA